MAERLLTNTGPGSIVLLHDAIFRSLQPVPQHNREPMLDAVRIFLERVGGRFQFLTVPELLQSGSAAYSKSRG